MVGVCIEIHTIRMAAVSSYHFDLDFQQEKKKSEILSCQMNNGVF